MADPARAIAHVAGAHRRLEAVVAGLTEADVRRPSLLPGWSVGHVLTHLARNADSHVRRAEAARRGEWVEQYPGGPGARDAAIEAGAGRPRAVLVEDVTTSARRVEAAWVDLPAAAWAVPSADAGGRRRALAELPARRWQEVEVHLVDLDAGTTWADWPDAFVAEWLPRLRAEQGGPAADVAGAFGRPADELAWRYGRLRRDDLPPPSPWG